MTDTKTPEKSADELQKELDELRRVHRKTQRKWGDALEKVEDLEQKLNVIRRDEQLRLQSAEDVSTKLRQDNAEGRAWRDLLRAKLKECEETLKHLEFWAIILNRDVELATKGNGRIRRWLFLKLAGSIPEATETIRGVIATHKEHNQ